MRNVEDLYPLTPVQRTWLKRLLKSQQGADIHLGQVSCVLRGECDFARFEQAWRTVQERHSVLRTLFLWRDLNESELDEPVQVVRHRVDLPWRLLDWRRSVGVGQEQKLAHWLLEDRARGFSLHQAPLTRLTLIRLKDDHAHLVWTYHRLILDRRAAEEVLREVWMLYETLGLEGTRPPLKTACPLRDAIAWLQRQDFESMEDFWRRELQDAPPPSCHPLLQASDATDSSKLEGTELGLETEFVLGKIYNDRLQRFLRRRRVPLRTFIEAAWVLFLLRATEDQEVMFCTSHATQPPGLEGCLGPWTSFLPVRIKRPDELSWGAWLEKLQVKSEARQQHGYITLDDIQGWSGIAPEVLHANQLVFEEPSPLRTSLDQTLTLETRFSTPAVPMSGLIVRSKGDELALSAPAPLASSFLECLKDCLDAPMPQDVLIGTSPMTSEIQSVEGAAVEGGIAKEADHLSFTNGSARSLDDGFYLPTWQRAAPVASQRDVVDAILLFLDDQGIGLRLAEVWRETGFDVFCVEIGETFGNVSEKVWRLDPWQHEDYLQLARDLQNLDVRPTTIVHLWGLTSDDEAPVDFEDLLDQEEDALHLGFFSLLSWFQTWQTREDPAPIDLAIVTNHLHEVTGSDLLCPLKAAVLGMVRVLPREHPELRVRAIDLATSEVEVDDQLLADEILARIPERVVALRGGHRWKRVFEPISLAERSILDLELGEGLVLMTGAEQEIGLCIAEHLASLTEVRLALLVDPSFEADSTERLEALCEQTVGMILPVDLGDVEAVARAVEEARQNLGEVRGVVHAASVQGGGFLRHQTQDRVRSVLQPKVRGTLALAAALEESSPEFILLFSSIVAITGEIGQADRAAANAVLDAIADFWKARTSARVTAIGWSPFPWEEKTGEELDAHEISSIFDRILDVPISRVVVAPHDLKMLRRSLDVLTLAPEPRALPFPLLDSALTSSEVEHLLSEIENLSLSEAEARLIRELSE